MLAQLWQRRHCNKGNNCHCNNGKDACASMATMPLQQGQQRHHNDSKDNCTLMMMTMPLQQGKQCQLEDSNNAITTRATMPSRIKGNNAIVTRATMPTQQQERRLPINNGSNAIVMRATITIAMMAKTPAHQQ